MTAAPTGQTVVLQLEPRHWRLVFIPLIISGLAVGGFGLAVQPGVSLFTLLAMILIVAGITIAVGEAKPTPIISAGPGGIALRHQAPIPWSRVQTVLVRSWLEDYAGARGTSTGLVLVDDRIGRDDPLCAARPDQDQVDPRITADLRLPDLLGDFSVADFTGRLRRYHPELLIIDLRRVI